MDLSTEYTDGVVARRTLVIKGGLWLVFIVLLYFYLQLFKNALIDDAFITLRYVKTLITSGTWGLFPGYVANSATSPLNVLLLTAISRFTGPTVDAVFWLSFIGYIFISVMLVQISNRLFETGIFGWLAAVAIVCNPLLISTMGLESILFISLFTLALYSHISKKWDLLAVSLGLLTITRADGALFFFVFLSFLPEIKQKIQAVVLFGLSIAPWYLFSWMYLGSALPDTVFIKTDQASWSQWDFFNGLLLYLRVYPLETILSFIFIPLVGFALNNKNWRNTSLLIVTLAGVIHFIGYTLLRVPPFHWYYVPEIEAIILMGSFGLGFSYKTSPALRQGKTLKYITALFIAVSLLGMGYILARENFSVREMPIHSNWATHEQYKEIGLWLKRELGSETIRLKIGEVGTLAYYCDCYLLDRFSDRSWLEEYIHAHTGGLRGMFYQVNFKYFSPAQFSPETYSLRAYPLMVEVEKEHMKKWETSTRWIHQGEIFLYKGQLR